MKAGGRFRLTALYGASLPFAQAYECKASIGLHVAGL